ncbi:MAG: spermidine synthase [Planctomycetota bacterium]
MSAPPEGAPGAPAAAWRRYQAFVLLGALLLFGLEPLAGKLLLPRSGGGFHVWAASLTFFQGALFLGYVYCHLLAPRLGRGHLLLLLLALPFLPVGRGLAELPVSAREPVPDLLLGLTRTIGLPFLLLATTSVVAQRWLQASDLPERADPYPLYGISNAGSLLALLAYPLLVEPLAGLEVQRRAWSALYLVYLALAWSIAPVGGPRLAPAAAAPLGSASTRRQLLGWCVLSAAPSAFLMAVTQDIASSIGNSPLVWVLPLAAYLATFALAFARRPVYPAALRWAWPLLLALGLLHWLQPDRGQVALAVYVPLLFAMSLVAHGELHRARPQGEGLTAYYLAIALGGWLGGAWVVLVAPLLFDEVYEYPLTILALALALAPATRDAFAGLWRAARWRAAALLAATALVLLALVPALARPAGGALRLRDYYGIYRVADLSEERGGALHVERVLVHATTTHGTELRTALGRPVGYHHPRAPLGQAVLARRRPARIAVVGLGAGVLASYLEPGEALDFYELDPLVEEIARGFFTYLGTSRGEVRVIPGDARVRLAEARDGAYDLVLVDAFSGGVIPSHLLTREALELYRRKARPEALLVFHVSNAYYDLRAVLAATGASLDPPLVGAWAAHLDRAALAEDEQASVAFALAPDEPLLAPLLAQGWVRAGGEDLAPLSPWSDDYTNPLAALWAMRRARARAGR